MDSHLVSRNGQLTTYVGPDATNAFRAIVLSSSLKLYAATKIKPTRGVGIKAMLKMATGYTGKVYKMTEIMNAAEDVLKWANEMKAALPVIES